MKFTSSIISAGSGSLNGMTVSHNRGGMYARNRTVPTDPSTPAQQSVRGDLGFLATRWALDLTAAQRAAWNVYAASVPVLDSLGQTMFLTGLNWYLKSNVLRLAAGLSRVDAAPTDFTMAGLTAPVPISMADDSIDVEFTNTDEWATAVGGALAVFASMPKSPGVNFFKGPYTFVGTVAGAATPPTSPATLTSPYALTAGQRQFFRFVAMTADGRVSPNFRTFSPVV